MKRRIIVAITCGLLVASTSANDRAGDFDYYVFALSWNAGWCAVEGTEKGAPTCSSDRVEGFTAHGLWPQYNDGWPQYCSTNNPNPSRSETARQAELFGGSGAAWHQWNKHGRCTGKGFAEYYDDVARLYDGFNQPEIFLGISEPLSVAPEVIEAAIIEVNPELTSEGIAIICKDGSFTEARICLDQEFNPIDCIGRAARDCGYSPTIEPAH